MDFIRKLIFFVFLFGSKSLLEVRGVNHMEHQCNTSRKNGKILHGKKNEKRLKRLFPLQLLTIICFAKESTNESTLSLISTRDHCQRFPHITQAGYEPVQNLSSTFFNEVAQQ